MLISKIFLPNQSLPCSPNGKIKKWTAYLDKYLVFHDPKGDYQKGTIHRLVHINDHSNAPYQLKLTEFLDKKISYPCDLIAIQTALGQFSEAPTSSKTGKFSKMILKSLN